MATYLEDKPALLVKKLGGLALILLGLLSLALSMSGGYPILTVLGLVLLLAGMVLIALKIARRNRDV